MIYLIKKKDISYKYKMSDRIKNIVVTITFFGVIVILLLANIIKKDGQISISERRKLEQIPTFSITKLFNGTFFEKMDKYLTEQFIKREEFRKLKIGMEFNVLKKKDYNKLYKYNDYIIEQNYPLDKDSVLNLINKIKQIKDNYLTEQNNIYFTIIPDKNYFVNEDNLKIDYNEIKTSMQKNLEFAKYIEICDILNLDDYYKTDTHWKQENLIKVAQKIGESMGININTEYEIIKVGDFKGVYSGQLPIEMKSDEIKILNNDILENCIVYNYENMKKTKIYNLDKQNSFDKYDIYLSGAVSLLTIKNNKSRTEKELIVFRDSYASSLIPLLVSEYSKITMIDTRYISPKILSDYIEFEGKDILFIYSTMLINNSISLK